MIIEIKAGVKSCWASKNGIMEAVYAALDMCRTDSNLLEKYKESKNTRRSIDYKELIDNNCIYVLKKINPELTQLYLGSAQSIAGNNVDRTRHTFSSIRTMWEEILSHLAPESDVLVWLENTKRSSYQYIYEKYKKHKGKVVAVNMPTRLGRLLYAFRNQLSDSFFKIISKQVEAIKNYIEELNLVHKSFLNFTRKKLKSFFMLGNTQLSSLRSIFT
ncbi:hypothetical protein D0S45_03475 [Marinifilum sp. JC120]|nr:hypothetical protein D0S45_03475 [Marinifilum sp. JC120]